MVEPGEMPSSSPEPFDGMVVNAMIPFQWKDGGLSRGWVSVRDGFIDDAGAGDPPGHARSKDSIILDADGRYLFPGMIDAHMHLFQWSRSRNAVDLSSCGNLRSLLSILRERMNKRDEDPIYRGCGIFIGTNLDLSLFTEGEKLDGRVLDRTFPDEGVMLQSVCGHKVIMNRNARERINVEWELPESGVLLEERAMEASWHMKMDTSSGVLMMEDAISEMLRKGVVGGVDIIPESMLKEQQAVLELMKFLPRLSTSVILSSDTKLNGSLHCLETWDDFMNAPTGPETGEVIFSKFFMDGSIGARTASFFRDYEDANSFSPMRSGDEMSENARSSLDRGLVPMIHAIGDAAVSRVLEAGETIRGPIRMEHVEAIREKDVPRLDTGEMAICMQPNFMGRWGMEGELYEKALGSMRLLLNRFSTLKKHGRGLLFGSDMMPLSPMFGLKSAMSHPNRNERLDLSEAVEAYTSMARSFSFPGHLPFSGIEVDQRADIVIFSMGSQDSSLTLLGGRMVHTGPDIIMDIG